MRKTLFFLLLMLSFCGVSLCTASAQDFYEQMPQDLQVIQKMYTEEIEQDIYIRRTYPETNNPSVDMQMRALIDNMAELNLPLLPRGAANQPAYLEVGAVITRTGTSWMSFLTLGEVSSKREMLNVDYETRVYDIQSGERITLTDVFAPDSDAWLILARAVREQLSAAFPDERPDERALEELCALDSLQNASFTLGAARLLLTYRADTIYPDKNVLLHVALYYPEIRPLMTERAKAQTDNSRFRMIALTYDDGGARLSTRRVLDTLREHAAQATFFIVGQNIRTNREFLCRQHNSGYSLQSHTYTHRYPEDLTTQEAFKEKERFAQEMSALIGIAPTLMRAPGGNEKFYISREIGYPLIHWSLASGDSGSTDVRRIARRVLLGAQDGAIVLMHDLNTKASEYTTIIVEELNRRGFLCVTVEELFADAGVTLEANQVYFAPYEGR